MKRFNIDSERLKKLFHQAISPVFIMILMGSCLLWFIKKLDHEYTATIPLNVWIDGQKYRMAAIVTGRGSTIVAQQMSLKSKLHLTLDELSTRRSREKEGALTITPASLGRAINAKINGLKVDQVVEAPDFIPAPADETPKERRDRLREERRQVREAKRAAKAAREAEELARETAEKEAGDAESTLRKAEKK